MNAATAPTAAASTAILLIAHGSRRKEANDDLVRLAEFVIKRRPGAIVEIAYLELTSPTIPEGARACIDRGANRVLMAPFFLSAGAHVTRDLEQFRAEFTAGYPGVAFMVCPPLGLHPLLVDVLMERIAEAEVMGIA